MEQIPSLEANGQRPR